MTLATLVSAVCITQPNLVTTDVVIVYHIKYFINTFVDNVKFINNNLTRASGNECIISDV